MFVICYAMKYKLKPYNLLKIHSSPNELLIRPTDDIVLVIIYYFFADQLKFHTWQWTSLKNHFKGAIKSRSKQHKKKLRFKYIFFRKLPVLVSQKKKSFEVNVKPLHSSYINICSLMHFIELTRDSQCWIYSLWPS